MCGRQDGLLLVNGATLAPLTHIQYFRLSPRSAPLPAKVPPCFTFVQMSGLCLHSGVKVLVFHHLQWPFRCSDTDAAAICEQSQILNWICFLREEVIEFSTLM